MTNESGDGIVDAEAIDEVLEDAATAAPFMARMSPGERALLCHSIADQLERGGDRLIALAATETHLSEARLRGELARTTFQWRLFADVLDDGGYLDVAIDSADPAWPSGPRSELRRMLRPIGPAVIFPAGNFPFAFGVAGGDTASAIAAGCPVIVKAHPGYADTSRATAAAVAAAVESAGAHPGAFSLIEGEASARRVLVDARMTVATFTGSRSAGRALFDLAAARPVPIPFYAEMGSCNPVFVTSTALERRGAEILAGLVASFTLGVGQFCTKPGVVLIPSGEGVEQTISSLTRSRSPERMLSPATATRYAADLHVLESHAGVEILVGEDAEASGDGVLPTVLLTTVKALLEYQEELLTECFGPVTLLVTYDEDAEMLLVADALEGQLTASVHGEADEAFLPGLVERLAQRAGRVVWNEWPTGVAVSWAMTHGGPYPATTSSSHTSVGTGAIERFLRPVTYQSVPAALLPPALREGNPLGVPRRIDGARESAATNRRK